MDELFKGFLDTAKDILKGGQSLVPVMFFMSERGVSPVPVRFKDDLEKQQQLFKAGAIACLGNCTQVGFLCDAAMRTVDPDTLKDGRLDPTEFPLTYPKTMRQECIVLSVVELKNRTATGYVAPYKETDSGPVFEETTSFDEGFEGAIKDTILAGYDAAAKEKNHG